MKNIIIGILIALTLGNGTVHAQMRMWTDKKGNSIEAEFVTIVAGKVVLKKADGKQIKVPQKGLSHADKKYLETVIPPKIDIKIYINKKRKKLQEFEGYVDYSEKIKGEVTLTKKNRDPSSRQFTALLYIFSKDIREDEIKILDKSTHKFSFEHQKKVEFTGNQSKVNYSDWVYDSLNHGDEYEGYLLLITDDNDKIIAAKGSRPLFENKASQIMKAKPGATIDL